jgi:hypothetical protein
MAYSTLGWQNGQAPAINASNLNHMDQGIADADAAATAAATLAGQKMDKVSGGEAGDFASLDANGNVVDSGKSANDFAPASPNGYVEKQTTTSGSWRAYVYNNTGDNSLLVMSGGDGTVDPTGTGIAATTGGKLRTNTPTGPYHAANKKYVDDNFFQKAVVTPSLSTYQDINGYTWQELYAAMQNAGDSLIYLNNSDRWLHFGTNRVDTICNQFITFIFDEILGNKFFFVLKYVKEQAGTQTIQEIQCSITSTGVISAA